MEIKTLSDMAIYLGTVAGALVAIGVVLRYILVRPLRRWMIEQVRDPMHAMAADVGEVAAEVGATSGNDGEPRLKEVVLSTGLRVTDLERQYRAHMQTYHGIGRKSRSV